MHSTILFVSYGGGHVNMLIPLLRRLRKRDDLRCVTLALTTAAHELARHGLDSRGFASLLHEDDTVARSHGERLVAKLPEGGGISRAESIAYLGLSYADLEARLGVEGAMKEYTAIGRQAFLPLEPMRRLFDEVQPDLVVTTISPRAEKAAQLIARERGIPSLCLVDLFARPSLRRAAESGYGSRVCVISEGVREWLIEAGREADEIVVTGNPAFDKLSRNDLDEAARNLRARRGWGEERVILWASQIEPERNPFSGSRGDPELPKRIEQALLDILARRSDWRLVIRPHPNEPVRTMPELERVEMSGPDDDLHTLLAAVDLVVIMTSTVGVEARLLGKPLISIDLSVFSLDTPYQDAGLSYGVNDLAELEKTMEDALATPAQLPAGFPPPGGATDAVLAEIDSLLVEGRA